MILRCSTIFEILETYNVHGEDESCLYLKKKYSIKNFNLHCVLVMVRCSAIFGILTPTIRTNRSLTLIRKVVHI